ncbi:hypothetical protein [Solimicrobium silvestre]|nr:hypothetical protein [Solimicrobium silvestre]
MKNAPSILNVLYSTLTAKYWKKRPESHEIIVLALLLVFMSYKMMHTGWVPLLDWATLTIHEAGHPIIGMLLGNRMMVYGGSLFQLIFPLVFVWHFARQDQALGYCFAISWEASSLHALGRYVADARAQELPLVGNGDRIHDWNEILGRWNLLDYDRLLGGWLYVLCWMLMACCFFMLWNLWRALGDAGE